MAQKLCAEVLVIGGGPAGLSAALALCRQKYRTIVFDSGVYRNSKSHHMHTVPTWDHKDAKDFRVATRKEILERYNTTLFVDEKVNGLEKRDNGTFAAACANGQTYTANRVVLATGITDVFPDIKGYSELWGSSIFHCLFCHGYEEAGEHGGVLAVEAMANAQMAVAIGSMAKRLAAKVTLFTNGNEELSKELRPLAEEHHLLIDDRKIAGLKKVEADKADLDVCFEGDATERLAFLQHMPRGKPNAGFAEPLGLEVQPMGDYKVGSPMPETTVPGIFAVGDAGTMFKTVNAAIFSGGMAAGAIAHSLAPELARM